MKLVTYTTTSANMMLREIGLVLFLASVGIKAVHLGDSRLRTETAAIASAMALYLRHME